MSYISWIRQRVGHAKIVLVFASACVRDGQGRLLWQRRADFGWWGLPGGSLELDESLPQCVVREVREETGWQVEPVRLIGVYSSPDFDVLYPNGDQVQQVTVCFECRLVSNQPAPLDGGGAPGGAPETLDIAWFDLDRSPPTATWYAAMVADLRQGRKSACFAHGGPGPGRSGQSSFHWIRRHIGSAAYIVAGAACVVRDDQGRVLLGRRSDNGQWSLPAGMVELGERLDQTAISEVREETGLQVEPLRLVGVYSDGDAWHTYPNGDQIKTVTTVFECRSRGGRLQADGVEALEARFFPLDALPPLATWYTQRLRETLAGREEAFF